jgi:hypothetical protein
MTEAVAGQPLDGGDAEAVGAANAATQDAVAAKNEISRIFLASFVIAEGANRDHAARSSLRPSVSAYSQRL